MTDLYVDIRIRNADAHTAITRVAERVREELRRIFEDETIPPVVTRVTIHDGKGHASSRDIYGDIEDERRGEE